MILLPLFLGSALAAPAVEAPAPAAISSLSSLATVAVQGAADEMAENVWHGSVNLGLSKAEGNTDIETYALTAKGVRVVDIHRYTLEALWYYATQNNERTQRRALASGKYDQFFSERTYFLLNSLVETNEQAGIDLRWSIGAGIGHQWRDDAEWRINTEAGLSYFNEQFDRLPGGTRPSKDDYLAARFAWDVWKRMTDTLVFGHFAEIYPSLEDADDVYGRADTYLETQLSESMTARLSWIATYDNTPAAAGLDRLDNLYLLNVGWTF